MKSLYTKGIIALLVLGFVAGPVSYVSAHDDDNDAAMASSPSPEVQQINQQIKNLQSQIDDLKKKRATLLGNIKEEKKEQKKFCREFRKQLRSGMKDDEVEALQEALIAESLLSADAMTGFFGPMTRAALIKFQTQNGLPGAGEVGPATRALLMMKLKTRCGTINLPSIPVNFPTSTTSTTTGNVIKLTMCHKPGTNEQQTIEIPISAYFGHLQHGDKLGACGTTPPPADVTAPVLTELSAQNVATTSAKIRWVSNEPATSKVWYATSTNLSGAAMIENTSLVSVHEIMLTSLNASTTYYYKVESKDAAGNIATSSSASFTTTN